MRAAKYLVTELAAYGSAANAQMPLAQSTPFMRIKVAIQELMLRATRGVAICVPERASTLNSREGWTLMQLLGCGDWLENLDFLSSTLSKGFDASVGLALSSDDAIRYFQQQNYEITSSASLADHSDNLLIERFLYDDCDRIYRAFGCMSVMVFGHDADPIYVIEIDAQLSCATRDGATGSNDHDGIRP